MRREVRVYRALGAPGLIYRYKKHYFPFFNGRVNLDTARQIVDLSHSFACTPVEKLPGLQLVLTVRLK